MDEIRNAAFVSVGRAAGFAGLAIFCLIFGLSFDMVLATRTGAFGCLVVTVVLAVYGHFAPTRPYKRTEVWSLLAAEARPHDGAAQRIIGSILRDTYFRLARHAAVLMLTLWAISLALQFLR